MSGYENELGGRVAVFGYAPWRILDSSAKRHQLIALADWASRDGVPLLIEETVRVVPFVRMDDQGERFVAVLLNASFDPTGPLTVRVRAHGSRVTLCSAEQNVPLPVERSENECGISLQNIEPWNIAILLGE
jgi:hypothetical protein